MVMCICFSPRNVIGNRASILIVIVFVVKIGKELINFFPAFTGHVNIADVV
jgi:hypothetical protein